MKLVFVLLLVCLLGSVSAHIKQRAPELEVGVPREKVEIVKVEAPKLQPTQGMALPKRVFKDLYDGGRPRDKNNQFKSNAEMLAKQQALHEEAVQKDLT